MRIILALAVAGFVFTSVVSGLAPMAPSTSVYAKKCSKSKCREVCTGKCNTPICDLCDRP
jgi:hypothetical protein